MLEVLLAIMVVLYCCGIGDTGFSSYESLKSPESVSGNHGGSGESGGAGNGASVGRG